jgi:hypothetical protein
MTHAVNRVAVGSTTNPQNIFVAYKFISTCYTACGQCLLHILGLSPSM